MHLSTAVLGLRRRLGRRPSESNRRPARGFRRRRARRAAAARPRSCSAIRSASAFAVSDAYDPYPIVDVHLWHDGGAIGFDFAAALDSPLQWIFEKAPGYLCCSISAAGEFLTVPTASSRALAWGEAQRVSAGAARRRRSAQRGDAQSRGDLRSAARRRRERGSERSNARLAIAGRWTDTGWPDTMESAVRSGKRRRAVLTRTSLECARRLNALERAVSWLLRHAVAGRAGGRASSRPTSR